LTLNHGIRIIPILTQTLRPMKKLSMKYQRNTALNSSHYTIIWTIKNGEKHYGMEFILRKKDTEEFMKL